MLMLLSKSQAYTMNGSLSMASSFEDLTHLSDLSILESLSFPDLTAATYTSDAPPVVPPQSIWGLVKAPNDPPWNSVSVHNGGIPGRGMTLSSPLGGRPGRPSLSISAFSADHRDLRSECGTAADSGYASAGVQQSIAASSAFGDGDQHVDAQSIVLSMGGSGPPDIAPELNGNQQDQSASYSSVGKSGLEAPGIPNAAASRFECSDCGEKVKNKSQLK
jgi:hypothetical protein